MKNILMSIMLLLLLFVNISHSQVPRIMNYQGKLTDPSGTALEGTYHIAFAIYDTADAGIPTWAETLAVDISNGLFDALLGTERPLDLDFCFPSWMELSISPDGITDWETMSPREKLATVSYAFRAVYADTADHVTGSARLRAGEVFSLRYSETFSSEQAVSESCRTTPSWCEWDISETIPEGTKAVELSVRFLPGEEGILEGNWGASGHSSSHPNSFPYSCGAEEDIYTVTTKVPVDSARKIRIYDDNCTTPLTNTGARFRVIGYWNEE